MITNLVCSFDQKRKGTMVPIVIRKLQNRCTMHFLLWSGKFFERKNSKEDFILIKNKEKVQPTTIKKKILNGHQVKRTTTKEIEK